jgi:hypothetical protein
LAVVAEATGSVRPIPDPGGSEIGILKLPLAVISKSRLKEKNVAISRHLSCGRSYRYCVVLLATVGMDGMEDCWTKCISGFTGRKLALFQLVGVLQMGDGLP